MPEHGSIEEADARARQLGRDEGAIPPGPYCYSPLGVSRLPDGTPSMKVRPCPYWASDPSRPRDESGYCAFLGEGDWQSAGVSLLFDQVKECGVSLDEERDL